MPASRHSSTKLIPATSWSPCKVMPSHDALFAAAPADIAARLTTLRDQIRSIAQGLDVPLEETLKWGAPSFVPPKRVGTTIRLGHNGQDCVLYVHCQTDLVSRWRMLFPTEFTYEGNRAVVIPVKDPFAKGAFDQIASMALTYHRDKRR